MIVMSRQSSNQPYLTDLWVNPKPESLSLLDDPTHVFLRDVEDYWGRLSLSFKNGDKDYGKTRGLKWHYHCVPPCHLVRYVPDIANFQIDWTTVELDNGEIVVIMHYGNTADRSYSNMSIGISLLATSKFAITKLRLIGEQVIQDCDDRIDKEYEKINNRKLV
jgi:hypothetical protein